MHVPKLYLTEPYSWKVRDIDIRPTYRCNAKCPTCGSWKRKSDDINFEQTEQIVKYFRNLRKVIIEGGEPTLWEHLRYFIENLDAKEKVVITNAINTKTIKDIAEHFTPKDMRWVVSLNGMEKAHDFSRGVKGAFKALVESIDIMKKHKYDIRFQFVGIKENMHDLDNVNEFIKKYSDYPAMVCYPSTSNIYGENIKCTYLNAKEMFDLVKSEKRGKLINKIVKDMYVEKALKKEPMPCLYGRSKIHITPGGKIEVCQYSDRPMQIGEVFDDKVYLSKYYRKYYCKNVIPNKCQYATGTLCSHEAVCMGIRHNLLYLTRETWKKLI